MTPRALVGLAIALVIAAGAVLLVASHPGSAQAPPAASFAVAPAPPPGVAPARWVPLGPTSGVALRPEPELDHPGVIHTGELWVLVAGRWRIVRFPAAPEPSGFPTVPAASF